MLLVALPRPFFVATTGCEAPGFPAFGLTATSPSLFGVIFRDTAVRVDFAFSTMLLSTPTDAACLRGETGRARRDFGGDTGAGARNGECGKERELEDLGERTCEGWSLAREGIRAVVVVLVRFLGFGRVVASLSLAFSLSVVEWSS